MKQLSVEWTKGLDPQTKVGFEQSVRNSATVLARLLAIAEEKEAELLRKDCMVDDFNNPNWALRQAYRNGERSQLRKLKDLLSFLKG